ncbi:OmpA family protein [Pseudomonas sp. NPDC087697]|uniref:OmpA family protein n=1 Tax=Pseudomonas sp. NPDC087697 TaxID=3364447 RepID=UPI0038180352
MSPNKSLALALCLSITGCAQTPQNDADGGHWWSFGSGSDKVASKDATKPDVKPDAKAAEAAAAAKAKSTASAAAPATPAAVPGSSAAAAAKADSESKWWWPFGDQPKAITKADIKDVPMPDPKITQAWLDSHEPGLRAAVQDGHSTVERRENVLVVVVPVDDSFNPKRPAMLLPSALGQFTKIAKLVENDPQTSILVLGHGDTTGTASETKQLSKDRATSVASIFSLSGLKQDRLMLRGMGDLMPRAANDSAQGRALNRRVEIMLTPRTTMLALLNKYSQPTPPAVEMVAAPAAKPAAPAVAEKKATSKKKGAASKKAPAKKAPAKKHPAKKPAADKADTAAKSTSGQ